MFILLSFAFLPFPGSVQSFGIPGGRSMTRSAVSNLEMKIFDWAKREKFETFVVPDGKFLKFFIFLNFFFLIF